MRTIVIGDVHGCYNELQSLLETLRKDKKYNPKTDKLIFLGDYIDRGENSRLVIKLIRELQKENENVIALMGNHEDMLLDYCYGIDKRSCLYNGGAKTFKSYQNYDSDFLSDIEWIEDLPLYYEDDNFVYVHAGINPNKSLTEQSRDVLLWTREDFIYSDVAYDKRVIFGHTPSVSITGSTKPYTCNGNICVDTGCVYNGALTALIIEDDAIKEFVQVENQNRKSKGDFRNEK